MKKVKNQLTNAIVGASVAAGIFATLLTATIVKMALEHRENMARIRNNR